MDTFLRDMPEVPMIFVNVAKERMAFRDTLDEDDFIEYLCSERSSDRSKGRDRFLVSAENTSASSWDRGRR